MKRNRVRMTDGIFVAVAKCSVAVSNTPAFPSPTLAPQSEHGVIH